MAKDTPEASSSYEKAAKENSDILTSKLMWTWCGRLIVLFNRMPHSAAGIYTRYLSVTSFLAPFHLETTSLVPVYKMLKDIL